MSDSKTLDELMREENATQRPDGSWELTDRHRINLPTSTPIDQTSVDRLRCPRCAGDGYFGKAHPTMRGLAVTVLCDVCFGTGLIR